MVDKEYILCAAIWYNDGQYHKGNSCPNVETGVVLMGHRHYNIISLMPTGRDYLKDHPERNLLGMDNFEPIQGFVTSTGRFVDRKEGVEIAFAAGQVDEKVLNSGRLMSEDLY